MTVRAWWALAFGFCTSPFGATKSHPPPPPPPHACAGKFIAASLNDGKICIYDVGHTTWDRRLLDSHSHAVTALYWTQLPVGSYKGSAWGLGGGPPAPTGLVALLMHQPPLLPPEGVPYVYPPPAEEPTGDSSGVGASPRCVAKGRSCETHALPAITSCAVT